MNSVFGIRTLYTKQAYFPYFYGRYLTLCKIKLDIKMYQSNTTSHLYILLYGNTDNY